MSLRRFQTSVGAALAPAIVELSKQITPILARIIEWVQANAGLIVSGAKMALIVTALGGALFGLGQAILWAVSAGSALAAAWTFLTGVIAAAGTIIAGIGAPVLIVVGLYWMRWWAVRPPRIWADQFGSRP